MLDRFLSTVASKLPGGLDATLGALSEMSPLQSAVLSTVTLFLTLIAGLALAGYVALLAWVTRDARARGMEGAPVWVLLVMSTLFVGLLVYLFSRPAKSLQAHAPAPAVDSGTTPSALPATMLEAAEGRLV